MTADPTILEATARTIYDFDHHPMLWGEETENRRNEYRELATQVITAVTPLIRAAVLKEVGVVIAPLEKDANHCPTCGQLRSSEDIAYDSKGIAYDIRALKGQPYDIKKAIPAIDPLTGAEER